MALSFEEQELRVSVFACLAAVFDAPNAACKLGRFLDTGAA